MNGIICINKPQDMTSFTVVSRVRGILREKKVGHTGTLDPMATGVLPVMLGSATRFLNYLPDSDKAYRAAFILGKTTDTLDITGKVTAEYAVTADEKDVRRVLPEFTGEIMQVPPMYSAKSVDGVRLYTLARQGIEVDRKPCRVNVRRLELVKAENGVYTIDVICSKGTYIRSLIDDIGRALGCGAVMTALCRTGAMGFGLEDCVTLEALQQCRNENGDFSSAIIPLERVFASYERVAITPAQATRFSNGGALDIKRIKNPPAENKTVCVYTQTDEFLGLGKHSDGELAIVKLLPR